MSPKQKKDQHFHIWEQNFVVFLTIYNNKKYNNKKKEKKTCWKCLLNAKTSASFLKKKIKKIFSWNG